MNILSDKLPEGVKVNGTFFYLNTDFRAGIKFDLMLEAGESDVLKILRLFFPEECPKDIVGALEAISVFFAGKELPKKDETVKKEKRSYSFNTDAETIFADFWQYYRIDLSTEYLHWFAFKALLEGLPDESGFKRRIYYRTCNLKDLPKKEKERIGKIRKLINIEQEERGKMTLAERNAQMLAYVQKRANETKGGEVNG